MDTLSVCPCGKPITSAEKSYTIIDENGVSWHGACFVSKERIKVNPKMHRIIVKGKEERHLVGCIVEANDACTVWAYKCWVEASGDSCIIDLGGNIIFAYQNARIRGLTPTSVLFVGGTLFVNREVPIQKVKESYETLEVGKMKR
ncbi:MAG: hypothetical protein NWF09_09895 [Candidatus Bathyarchaeota archaeon]|nr:hypothetical protein [Candidatus Bathyarchaeota archaeon]